MMFPEEIGGSVAPESALPPSPAPSEAPAAPEPSTELPTQAEPVQPVEKPAPELTLREKIQKKAEEVAKRHQKDPQTGKFLAKTPPNAADPAAVKSTENAPDPAQKDAIKPPEGAPQGFTPNFKLKVMEQDCEIPEILRPLMKDEASAKAIKELAEKALGVDYIKPKLEQTRTQLTTVSTENQTIRTQIQNAVQLFQRGDIDGWLKALQVPEERILQWVADKLDYSKLPPDQKAIVDSRKQADDRAHAAEQQAAHYRQQNEQTLNQQVQMGLDSVLARPDVDVVAKAYDTRTGKPGSFKAEINRRGDYIWRTTNKITPPDQLVQELLQIVGPIAPVATSPGTPAPGAAPQVQPAGAKTPVIPNISGRSVSALPTKVKSLADLRAKHKEFQNAKNV